MVALIVPLLPAAAISILIGIATGWWIWRRPAESESRLAADASSPEGTSGEPDDLTLLKGVGPRLAGQLNALGIFSFRQIAAWSPEQAAAADAELGRFSGCIARNQLVRQAQMLTNEESAD